MLDSNDVIDLKRINAIRLWQKTIFATESGPFCNIDPQVKGDIPAHERDNCKRARALAMTMRSS